MVRLIYGTSHDANMRYAVGIDIADPTYFS